jgi:septal ring factor EnvC (AmiA/AmiB activator)
MEQALPYFVAAIFAVIAAYFAHRTRQEEREAEQYLRHYAEAVQHLEEARDTLQALRRHIEASEDNAAALRNKLDTAAQLIKIQRAEIKALQAGHEEANTRATFEEHRAEHWIHAHDRKEAECKAWAEAYKHHNEGRFVEAWKARDLARSFNSALGACQRPREGGKSQG